MSELEGVVCLVNLLLIFLNLSQQKRNITYDRLHNNQVKLNRALSNWVNVVSEVLTKEPDREPQNKTSTAHEAQGTKAEARTC